MAVVQGHNLCLQAVQAARHQLKHQTLFLPLPNGGLNINGAVIGHTDCGEVDRIHQIGRTLVHRIDAVIPGDGVEPRGKLGIATKRAETAKGLDEDFLGEVQGEFAVAGETVTPGGDTGVIAAEDFVEEFALVGGPVALFKTGD